MCAKSGHNRSFGDRIRRRLSRVLFPFLYTRLHYPQERICFISATHGFLVVFARALVWWRATEKETPAATIDAQKATPEGVKMLLDLRMQLRLFSPTASKPDLQAVFSKHDGVLQSVLCDVFSASAFAKECVRLANDFLAKVRSRFRVSFHSCDAFRVRPPHARARTHARTRARAHARTHRTLGARSPKEKQVGGVWSGHLSGLDAQIRSWCPAGFDKHGGQILAMADALLQNNGYDKLPAACNLLSQMLSYVAPLHHGMEEQDPILARSVVDSASDACKLGVRCVTLTFGVFLATTTLPSIANDKARAVEVRVSTDGLSEGGEGE